MNPQTKEDLKKRIQSLLDSKKFLVPISKKSLFGILPEGLFYPACIGIFIVGLFVGAGVVNTLGIDIANGFLVNLAFIGGMYAFWYLISNASDNVVNNKNKEIEDRIRRIDQEIENLNSQLKT